MSDFYSNNKITDFSDKLLLQYYKKTDHPAMPVWRAFFTESFPEFDMGKAVDSKGDYIRKNREKIEEAVALADKMTKNYFNVPTRAAEKITSTINKKSGILGKSAELLLGFTYNERAALANASHSLLPNILSQKGDINRTDAAKLVATITVRGLAYPALQAIGSMWLAGAVAGIAFGEGDSDEDDLSRVLPETMARFGMFLVGGQLNAHKMMAFQLAVSLTMGAFKDEDADDDGKKPLVRTPRIGLHNLGITGEVLEHLQTTGDALVKLIENKDAEEFNAKDKEVLLRYEAISTLGAMMFGLNMNTIVKAQKKIVKENE
jgi:hypothetical protein